MLLFTLDLGPSPLPNSLRTLLNGGEKQHGYSVAPLPHTLPSLTCNSSSGRAILLAVLQRNGALLQLQKMPFEDSEKITGAECLPMIVYRSTAGQVVMGVTWKMASGSKQKSLDKQLVGHAEGF